MNKHDDHFQPESLETQIRELAQIEPDAEGSAVPAAQMVKDLQSIYTSYTQSGERVWERLARHIAEETDGVSVADGDEITTYEGDGSVTSQQEQLWQGSSHGRSQAMKPVHWPTRTARRGVSRRLAVVAAVLVAGLLVSSFLWIVYLIHAPQVGGAPVIPSHAIYLFKKDGIDKIDLRTHKILWHLAHTYQEQGVPLTPITLEAEVVGDNLYLFDRAHTVVAINIHNGVVRWSRIFPSLSGLWALPTLVGGLLYVYPCCFGSGEQQTLYGLDPATGALKTTLNGVRGDLMPMSVDDSVFYSLNDAGNSSGITAVVSAIQLPGGKPLWHASISVKNANFANGPYVYNGVVYLTFDIPGSPDRIYALDSHTGKVLRNYPAPNYPVPSGGNGLRDMFIVGNTIYSPGTDGYVYALDARTGKLAWKRPFDATIALATSNVIYLHTNINMHMTDLYPDLVAIRAKDGAILWHLSIPGLHFTVGSILNVDGILYDLAMATDSHGRIIPNTGIYAVRSSDGKLLWHLPVTGGVLVA